MAKLASTTPTTARTIQERVTPPAGSDLVSITIPAHEFGPVIIRNINLGPCTNKAARGARLLMDGYQKTQTKDSRGVVPNSIPAAIRALLEDVADAYDRAAK